MTIWRQFWISPNAHAVAAQTLARQHTLQHTRARHPQLRLLHAVCITPANTPFSHSRRTLQGGQLLLSHYSGPLAFVLKEIDGLADEIVLDACCLATGLDPHAARALARCCRPGTLLQLSGPAGPHAPWAKALKAAGFAANSASAHPHWTYAPHWPPRTAAQQAAVQATLPGRCLVLGAGLAGAAVAASLARRGWQVCVLDAQGPASGASGVPVGLLAPHTSKDHNVLSRISRAGVQATWAQAQAYLQAGQDFAQTGVTQRNASHSAQPTQWHASGGWIKPARLVQAWLQQPGITLLAGRAVARLAAPDARHADWRALDASGQLLASACLVVIAAGTASADLAHSFATTLPCATAPGTGPGMPPAAPPARPQLQAIRGQLSWGKYTTASTLQALLPGTPVNGYGSLISAVPCRMDSNQGSDTGLLWLCGATYQRDDTDLSPRPADHAANLARLPVLLPDTGAALEKALSAEANPARASAKHLGVQAWVGVRCASIDRLPLVGPWPAAARTTAFRPANAAHPLWLCTALGSRGLSYAALCAELLAARLHQEPLPLPASLARCLEAGRGGRHRVRAAQKTAALP